MKLLYQELHRWHTTPHEWSQMDCFISVGDWVRLVKGVDPVAHLRGTYGHPDFCKVAMEYRSNPNPPMSAALASLPVVDKAEIGDVALVQIAQSRWLCGAMKLTDNDWALKAEDKPVLITKAVKPLKIWSVGYEG